MKCQLEVFKTKTKGWGVRCRHDIPSGAFVCSYSGEIITDEESEKRGPGVDEYFTKLDLIETIQRKPGYESHVLDPEKAIDPFDSNQDSDSSSDCPSTLSLSPSESLSSDDGECNKRKKGHYGPAAKRIKMNDDRNNYDDHNDCDERIFKSKQLKDFLDVRKYLWGAIQKLPQKESTDTSHNEGNDDLGGDEGFDPHILDAKRIGNVGRFLNHSCQPNCFIQNVYIDTHDPRFHHLAFFSYTTIKAMTELTWNYAYDKSHPKFKCLCESCHM